MNTSRKPKLSNLARKLEEPFIASLVSRCAVIEIGGDAFDFGVVRIQLLIHGYEGYEGYDYLVGVGSTEVSAG